MVASRQTTSGKTAPSGLNRPDGDYTNYRPNHKKSMIKMSTAPHRREECVGGVLQEVDDSLQEPRALGAVDDSVVAGEA